MSSSRRARRRRRQARYGKPAYPRRPRTGPPSWVIYDEAYQVRTEDLPAFVPRLETAEWSREGA